MIITDRIRVYSLFVVLSVFMFMVGVASASEPPKPGEIIGPDNIEKYKEYLPSTYIVKFIKERGHTLKLMEKPIELCTSKEMTEATKKYASACKLTPEGGLANYNSGFPFFEEEIEEEIRKGELIKAGNQIAWNMTQRYFGDDYHVDTRKMEESPWEEFYKRADDEPGCRRYCVNKYGNVIISDQLAFTTKCIGRVKTDPKPVIPGREELLRCRYYKILNPRDVAGQQILLLEYFDAKKNDDLWLFVPSIRRVKRMPTAQRSATRPPTDYSWDESWGWGGKVANFHWKFIKKQKALAIFPIGRRDVLSDNNLYFWDGSEAIMTDVYVIEAKPKDPSYAIPRRIYYVEPNNWDMLYTITYNKAGEEWKNMIPACQKYISKSEDDNAFTTVGNGAWIDLKSGHCTFMTLRTVPDIKDLDHNMYTVKFLYETSRGSR